VPRTLPTLLGVAIALCASSFALAIGAVPVAPPAGTDPTLSWTARILEPVTARTAPSAKAKRAARLFHYTAFSRRPQVLMVTGNAEETLRNGSTRGWVRVQLPKRPNGSQGWVPREAVVMAATNVRIRVRLGAKRVEVLREGRTIKSFKAAVGTGNTPTPTGGFSVQDPVTSGPAQATYLGPYIITLTAYSAVLRTFMGGDGLVAIHGTNAPSQLGRAVSHGCIRISNDAIRTLRTFADPGIPVDIVE
jgi:lipoprotein-anchoring transpeptidase ErfK/SrfK